MIINWKEVEIPEDKAAQIDERKESVEERKGTNDRESMVVDTKLLKTSRNALNPRICR